MDVDATKFVTESSASKEAFKTATLLRSLKVNALLRGETGVGKKTLARYILPSAPVVSGKNYDELLSVLRSESELIVTDIDSVANIKVIVEEAQKHSTRIVATASANFQNDVVSDFFAVSFTIPPLAERKEDADALSRIFLEEIEHILGEKTQVELSTLEMDLSKNAISLKRQLLVLSIFQDIDDSDIMQLLYQHLYARLGSGDDYKKFLYLYEAPLIKAGLKRFKSQLQLSEKLGLNRNTLRKKISQNKEYING